MGVRRKRKKILSVCAKTIDIVSVRFFAPSKTINFFRFLPGLPPASQKYSGSQV